jgi:hypothetical protein
MALPFFRPSRRTQYPRKTSRSFRPVVEVLEDRRLLATFTWFQTVDGTYGDSTKWHDQNGTLGLPGPNDDTSLPSGINVTSALARTVNSLTSNAHFEITAGTFTLRNVGHDSILSGLVVDAGAIFQVLGGTTYLSGCTIAGTIDVEPGATLRFLHGDNNLNSGTSLTGAGQYLVSGDTFGGPGVHLNTNVTAPAHFLLQNGILDGSGTLTINGQFDWISGGAGSASMAGTGITNVSAGATLHVGGTNGVTLNTRTINNAGTVNWDGASIWSFATGTFNNLAGANFNALTDQNVGFGGTFNNAGTFTKTSPVGTGITFFDSVFNNTGMVSIQSGVLQLNRGGTAGGTFNVSAGQLQFFGNTYTLNSGASVTGAGSTRVAGAQLTLAGNASAANLGLDSGTLGGPGTLTVTGTFDWTGGQIANPNGTLSLPTGSTLMIHGNSDKSLSGGTLNLAGAGTWQDNGNFNLGGNATLDIQSGGSFTINNDKSMAGPGTINNAGTFTKAARPGTTAVSSAVAFNNNGGIVQVLSGTLSFGSDFVQNVGGTSVAAGATLASSGNVKLNGGILIGSGTVVSTVTNAGIIAPGSQSSAGVLTVNGSYTQTSTGTLNLKIGGTTAGTQFDQLQISGAAVFAGTLNLSILNNFVPAIGNTFALIGFASRTGDFATENGRTQGARLFDPGYTTTGLNLLANATDTNQRFIVHLYSDLLARTPDAVGLTYWSTILAAGLVNRYQITQAFTHSLEYRIDEVVGLYSKVLHRTPDPVGLNACVGYLQAGGFVEQLAAVLAASPEYYQTRGGGTVDGFLSALYQDALGRPLDSASKTAWEQALANGVTQAQAAMAVYGSMECDLNTVQGIYQTFLHRTADSGGLNALAGAIAHGAHDEDVVALLLATDEYFNRS